MKKVMISRKVCRKVSAGFLAVLCMTSLTACGKGSQRVSLDENGNIKNITEINSPESGEYDPAGAAAYVYFSFQSYCLEGLIGYDESGMIVPAAAESWDISEDGLVYTFHIREDEKWSDGSDVTAADFKNTMVRALDPNKGSWYVDFLFVIKGAQEAFEGTAGIEELGVECLDDKTLEITLKQPCSYFLDLCKLPTYMPSNCTYATNEDEEWDMDPEKNLCNGPYHLTERSPGSSIVMEKNEYYHDADSVTVEAITDRFMDDDQAKAAVYESGEATIWTSASSSIAEKYQGKEDLSFTEIPQTNYILFNVNSAPFDDVKVRQAFSLAVSRQDICDVVGPGAEPSQTLVGTNYKSKVDGEKWGNIQGTMLEENLEKAKELLAEAGYPNGEGLPEIDYTYPAMSYEANVAQILQQQWAKLGVTVNLKAMEYEVYVDARRNGELIMSRMQWYADYNDPTSWLAMYTSGSAQNDIGWCNEKYDSLMAESDAELDNKLRQELMLEAEKIIVSEDTVVCPLFSNSNCNLIDPGLSNYTFDVLSYPDWSHMTYTEK